jgi:hypothetical protein
MSVHFSVRLAWPAVCSLAGLEGVSRATSGPVSSAFRAFPRLPLFVFRAVDAVPSHVACENLFLLAIQLFQLENAPEIRSERRRQWHVHIAKRKGTITPLARKDWLMKQNGSLCKTKFWQVK